MAECGETNVFGKNVIFTCTLMRGHEDFHSCSAVYNDKSWWVFRWGNANMIIPERNDRMRGIKELEEKLNKNNDTIFTVSLRALRGRVYPVLYTDSMLFPMDEIIRIEKILKEFGLEIIAIGANLDLHGVHGMYIETEEDNSV